MGIDGLVYRVPQFSSCFFTTGMEGNVGTIRVVNFDSDGKSDQKIDIFSANQISAFLQQLNDAWKSYVSLT